MPEDLGGPGPRAAADPRVPWPAYEPWFRALRGELIRVARQPEGTITYGELARRFQVDAFLDVGGMVGAVSEWEDSHGRPLLSAVVVNAETGMSGPGFVRMARSLGRAVGNTAEEQDAWYLRELRKVWQFWQRGPGAAGARPSQRAGC